MEERGSGCGKVDESKEGEWGEVEWMKTTRMRMKSEKHSD